MPVLAPLQPLFEAIRNAPRPSFASPAEARTAMHQAMEGSITGFYLQHEPLSGECDHVIPVAGGEITVRIYAPAEAAARRPCHVYYHGGSFWLGTLEHFDMLCRALAKDAGCIVASVAYRLAPEHRFPTAPEDAYAALVWLVKHAEDLGIDPARVSVGGVSAGGNLAAVVSLMARDRGGPTLVLQVLEIPITDLTNLESLRIPDEGLTLPSDKEGFLGYYLSDPRDATAPYASPLLAHDLSNLPPALVLCAEYDPLRQEGEAYAQRLADAGVATEHHLWAGQFHGAQQLAALIPAEAAAYQRQVVSALRRAYAAATPVKEGRPA